MKYYIYLLDATTKYHASVCLFCSSCNLSIATAVIEQLLIVSNPCNVDDM